MNVVIALLAVLAIAVSAVSMYQVSKHGKTSSKLFGLMDDRARAMCLVQESSLKIEDGLTSRITKLEAELPATKDALRGELHRVSLLAEQLLECKICRRIVPLSTGMVAGAPVVRGPRNGYQSSTEDAIGRSVTPSELCRRCPCTRWSHGHF